MTSNNGRDVYIREQYCAGQSAIELGAELGLSRSQIHRIVAAGPSDTDDGDPDPWTDDLGADDDCDEDYEEPDVVPPVTYCGKETVILPQGRGEEPKRVRAERWVDARGVVVNDLHFYRYRQSLRERGDAEAVKAFDDNIDRQRREYERRR